MHAHKKTAESGRTPPFPARALLHTDQGYAPRVIRTATASERPSVGPGRARGVEPARIPLWPPGQHEVPTNDEPRHQPARPETRPNQRLYVPLDHLLQLPWADRQRVPPTEAARPNLICQE